MLPRCSDTQLEEIFARLSEGNTEPLVGLPGISSSFRAEVMSLLAAHDRLGDFLEQPVSFYLGAESVDPLPEFSAGSAIGSYEVVSPLGDGGMGTVYLAKRILEDPATRSLVAVKVLHASESEALHRFRLEARALAELQHQGIAHFYDTGVSDCGRSFLAMEYVEGQDICRYCVEGGLPVHARLDLFLDVCHAVDHAHEHGFIHRDIKPSNVLVKTEGGRAVPKLIDFGIAKLLQGQGERPGLTRVRQMVGSPLYMSPEQINAHAAVGKATDIYALGVILYELLTGVHPLHPYTNDSLPTLFRRVCEEDTVRPSKRMHGAGAREAKALKGDLDAVVTTALAKEPEVRYRHVTDLANDIDAYLCGLPVRARSASLLYRARKFIARHRIAAGIASVALLVIVVGILGLALGLKEARRANEELQEEVLTSTRLKDFAYSLLELVDPYLEGDPSVSFLDVIRSRLPKIPEQFVDRPMLEGELRTVLATSMMNLGASSEAEVQFRESVRLLNTVGNNDPSALKALDGLAMSVHHQGRLVEAADLHQDVLEAWIRGLGPHSMGALESMNNLATVFLDQGKYREALELLGRAYDGCRSLEIEGMRIAQTLLSNTALVMSALGDVEEAACIHTNLLEAREKSLGSTHPDTLVSANNIAELVRRRGDLPAAEHLHRNTLQKLTSVFGANHRWIFAARTNLALVLRDQGRTREAFEEALAAHAGAWRTLGPRHEVTLKALSCVARLLHEEGSWTAAVDLQRIVVEASEEYLGPRHPVTLIEQNNLGLFLHSLGHLKEAREIYERTLPTRLEVLGVSHPATQESRGNLATLLFSEGKKEEAIELQREVLAVFLRELGGDHPRALTSKNNLALALEASGETEEASGLLRSVVKSCHASLGAEHPMTLGSIHNLALLLENSGEKEKALEMRERLARTSRRALGERHPNTLRALHDYASSLLWKGRNAEARVVLQEGARLAEQELGRRHPVFLSYQRLLKRVGE